MPQSPKELERIGEEVAGQDGRFESEDTAIEKAPPELECGQIPLKCALNMDAFDLHTIISSPQDPAPATTLHFSQEKKPLTLSSPEAWWKGGTTLAARRRRRNRDSSSSTKLTKPLAGVGDSLNWRLSVLHKINAIRYPW